MNTRFLSCILALLWAVGAQAQAPRDDASVIFRADYESRELTSKVPGLAPEGPEAPDAQQIDCTVARAGQCSIVTRLRMEPSYISAGAHRSETSTSRIPGTLYSPGDHFRYSFSLLIDAGWQADTRESIDSIWQFKRFQGHPDMFVSIKGDTLVWRITDAQQITLAKALPRGEWLDFVFDIHWSTGADGRAELTVTNARSGASQKFSYEGANMRDGKPKGGYVKWGIYKPGQLKRTDAFPLRVVHHDNIEIDRLK